MRALAAVLAVLCAVTLLVPSGALPALAGETTGSVEPAVDPGPSVATEPLSREVPIASGASPASTSAVEQPPAFPRPSAEASEETGPVGVWPVLASGAGTDSRRHGNDASPLEVRWLFALKGAPQGTEFSVWAEFASAGEIEAIGVDRVIVVTKGHDVLDAASAHCIIPSLDYQVSFELVSVQVVPAPVVAAETGSGEGAQAESSANTSGSRRSRSPAGGSGEVDGEPFLPFTGADSTLPAVAVLAAVLGSLVRRRAGQVG